MRKTSQRENTQERQQQQRRRRLRLNRSKAAAAKYTNRARESSRYKCYAILCIYVRTYSVSTFNTTRYDDDDDEEEGNGCFAHTKNRSFLLPLSFVRYSALAIAAYSRIFVDLVESCFVLCCVLVVCTPLCCFSWIWTWAVGFVSAWNGMDFRRTNEQTKREMDGCTG